MDEHDRINLAFRIIEETRGPTIAPLNHWPVMQPQECELRQWAAEYLKSLLPVTEKRRE